MTDTHIPPGEPGAALPAAGRFRDPGDGPPVGGLFTAGDTGPVRAALERLAAMRAHMRSRNLDEEPDTSAAEAVGTVLEEI